MTAADLCWMLIAAFALLQFWRIFETRGYCCPQCGTRRPGEHAKGCSWRG